MIGLIDDILNTINDLRATKVLKLPVCHKAMTFNYRGDCIKFYNDSTQGIMDFTVNEVNIQLKYSYTNPYSFSSDVYIEREDGYLLEIEYNSRKGQKLIKEVINPRIRYFRKLLENQEAEENSALIQEKDKLVSKIFK